MAASRIMATTTVVKQETDVTVPAVPVVTELEVVTAAGAAGAKATAATTMGVKAEQRETVATQVVGAI